MLMCLPEEYKEKLARSLYIINKEAKKIRDAIRAGEIYKPDWKNAQYIYSETCQKYMYRLKDRVLIRLDNMGEITVDGYHYLYTDWYTEESVYGILYRLGSFTFHYVEEDGDAMVSDHPGIKYLGDLNTTISSHIDVTKFMDTHGNINMPTVSEAITTLENFCKSRYDFYDETDELYAQFGL